MDPSALNLIVPAQLNKSPSASKSFDDNHYSSDKSNKSSDELEEISREPKSSRRSTRKIMPRTLNKDYLYLNEIDQVLNQKQIKKYEEEPPCEPTTIKLLKKRPKKDSSAKKQYCICKSNDDSRAMVKCDSCKIWYHLDCLGYTEAEDIASLEAIPRFICPICSQKETHHKSNTTRISVIE